jgi:epoxide hydrolase-like predicted phosphatase
VFDFGGVLITPITDKIARLADRHGVAMETLLEVLMGLRHESTADHPWHRAERGEVAVADLQELAEPYAEKKGLRLDGDEIDHMLAPTYLLVDPMIERLARLRDEGYVTALLTNSFREFRPILERNVDFALFDVIVDSSEVGFRKPEPAIYALMAERLGVAPARTVYLDDFADNLAGAKLAGWACIHVREPAQAIAELDQLLAGDRELTS